MSEKISLDSSVFIYIFFKQQQNYTVVFKQKNHICATIYTYKKSLIQLSIRLL